LDSTAKETIFPRGEIMTDIDPWMISGTTITPGFSTERTLAYKGIEWDARVMK
jgi:hypothetical protein